MTNVDKGISAIGCFWLVWIALKLVAIVFLATNLIAFINAAKAGTLGTFDYSGLVWSAIGTIVL